MRPALLFLTACVAEAPLSGSPPPCVDGFVACDVGVCVAEDELCPVPWDAVVLPDPLVHLRREYGVGGDVCGGEVELGGVRVRRWWIESVPGRIDLAIDADADGDVDERVRFEFTSPHRIVSAVREDLLRSETIDHRRTHELNDHRVRSVDVDSPGVDRDSTTTWDYRFREYTATTTTSEGTTTQTVELDEASRVVRIVLDEDEDHLFFYDRHGRLREEQARQDEVPLLVQSYQRDSDGELTGWTRSFDDARYRVRRDRYGRVEGLDVDHGRLTGHVTYFRGCD
jgi:hypothetical protein